MKWNDDPVPSSFGPGFDYLAALQKADADKKRKEKEKEKAKGKGEGDTNEKSKAEEETVGPENAGEEAPPAHR